MLNSMSRQAPVLGGPECVRVVLSSSSSRCGAKVLSLLACGCGDDHVDSDHVAGSIGATTNQWPY